MRILMRILMKIFILNRSIVKLLLHTDLPPFVVILPTAAKQIYNYSDDFLLKISYFRIRNEIL